MIVTGIKKSDRVLVKKEFIEHNEPKSSAWQAINVNGFSTGYIIEKNGQNMHGQQRVRSLNCWLCFCRYCMGKKKTISEPVANFVQIWSIQEFFRMWTVLRNVSTFYSSPPKYSSQGFEYWWKEEAKFNFWNFHMTFSTILANPLLINTRHGEKKKKIFDFLSWRVFNMAS